MTARAFFAILAALGAAACAHARLGETMSDLVARFGEASKFGKGTVFMGGSQRELGQLFTFRLEDWRIDVVMIDGVCARIRYAKPGSWAGEQIDAVLAANARDLAWTEQPPPSPESRKWLRTDGATALWQKTGVTLELPLYQERSDALKAAGKPSSRRR